MVEDAAGAELATALAEGEAVLVSEPELEPELDGVPLLPPGHMVSTRSALSLHT